MIVKSGRRICGTGAALANAPLVQDKSYFELKIQCGGAYSTIATVLELIGLVVIYQAFPKTNHYILLPFL